ncbi:MAG TPA: S-layer homology domain-containing protein [Anaerolineales bacterium]|nr:S-layer homology domain-containing protein [Anaerolineales bacterium]
MKTNIKQSGHVQRLFHLLMALGLLTLLFAPLGAVRAQTEIPPPPLSSQLTWADLGAVERAFVLNGESVTLSGTSYQAGEEFNLEGSDEIAAYYSTASLAELGWEEINTTPYPNGVTSLYFHSSGTYAIVEFVGCESESALSCLTVWGSNPTDVVPVQDAENGFGPKAVGTVSKSAPANSATNVDTSVTLSWGAYTGTDLNRYRYCIDKSNDSQCDASGGWTAVWSGRSVTVSGLETSTRYYWQVQAVLDDDTKVDANGGSWWSFTTKAQSNTAPGAFVTSLPASGGTGQSVTPTLVWQASSNATAYEYCLDTANNNICDNNWVSTNNTFLTLMTGVGANITYYWQVRATNSAGVTYANGGTWASFTTAVGPANDTVDSASTVNVPYENIVNTTSATLDTGTANACSPSLGLSSVWYKYTAASNRKIYLDTFGTTYNTFIAVWTKNVNGSLSLVVCNDDASGVTQSNVNLAVINGTTYYIQVAQKNSGSATVATPGGTLSFRVRNFADVAGNSPFWKNIEGIYAAGITGGCATSPDLLYCPASGVNRATMAVFILRGMKGPAYDPPAVGASTGFLDVPATYWAAAWIKQLAAEGITAGCGSGNYCPESLVTRAEMAIFLLRAKHGAGYVPPAVGSSTGFTDVPPTYWAAAWVKQLAAEGITSGCGSSLYCPESSVTREQMAAFLSRTFTIPGRP